ncbi:SDR family oxidoreductase [Thermithiobacillus plumbiphilus]|uniref:NADP-dependent 3-hydroxy acid dehydrogenase YdfG n=1 Tax=Thermithiobacillus plumbiphilus TaxID=1729899 RepID=A0ABU9DA90_9PROT
MTNLAGKRAWVTGASSGIGEATAIALAKAGAEVVLSARREERLREVAQSIQNAGGKAQIKPVDVADRSAMEQLGKALESMGGIDILINNAGLMPLAPMLDGRVDEWEQMIDINIKGLLYAINAVLPGMAQRKRGHIVNLGSVAGRVTFTGGAVYCGTKFAVRAISDALRKEGTQFGLRVTDIQPGAVATELPLSIRSEAVREMATGAGGFYGPDTEILQAEDIANAILYAVTQPPHVDVSELLIRPQRQEV